MDVPSRYCPGHPLAVTVIERDFAVEARRRLQDDVRSSRLERPQERRIERSRLAFEQSDLDVNPGRFQSGDAAP